MSRGRTPELGVVEESLRIDLAEPFTRRALRPGVMTMGTWTWSRGDDPAGAVRYTWYGHTDPPRLELSFSVGGAPVRQSIPTATTRPRFGGTRLWFICPALGTSVRALFLPPGGRSFAGRVAWRLTYRSRRESGANLRLMRLLSRCGALGGPSHRFGSADVADYVAALDEEQRDEKYWRAVARRNEIRRIRRRERLGQ